MALCLKHAPCIDCFLQILHPTCSAQYTVEILATSCGERSFELMKYGYVSTNISQNKLSKVFQM